MLFRSVFQSSPRLVKSLIVPHINRMYRVDPHSVPQKALLYKNRNLLPEHMTESPLLLRGNLIPAYCDCLPDIFHMHTSTSSSHLSQTNHADGRVDVSQHLLELAAHHSRAALFQTDGKHVKSEIDCGIQACDDEVRMSSFK